MDLASFFDLLTPPGQEALSVAVARQPIEADFLSHLEFLRRRYPTGLAQAALETAILRQEARAKFPQADRLYFTRQAMEQASSARVANYRAGRYAGLERVADLGCSIGGDTLALAEHLPVVGLDCEPLRLALAQANLAACGLDVRAGLLQANLHNALPLHLDSRSGVFFDPARRLNGRRIYSVQDYHPPLAVMENWLRRAPALGVKLSPGVDLDELAPYTAGRAELEFISLDGELKEAVLWFGPLRQAARRATLLSSNPIGQASLTEADLTDELPLSPPRAVIYEPDPAILRAGLVAALGTRLEAAQLDRSIAYLTADAWQPTPFARAWAVEAWLPFNLKVLRAELRRRGVGRLTVKKRGSPLDPQSLIHQLHLNGNAEGVIFLTQLQGRPIVILSAGRIDRPASSLTGK